MHNHTVHVIHLGRLMGSTLHSS